MKIFLKKLMQKMLFNKTAIPTSERRVVIFTAPSGAGKTTLVRHLLSQIPALQFSISATTRPKRDSEVNGQDYYFLSKKDFFDKVATGDFLEWEEVYADCCYGTLKKEVDRIWSSGHQVIFDVDVKGATNIKNFYGDRALAIYIKPPSLEVLIERLKNRKTESFESLQRRIKRATLELEYENDFDCVIVNDKLDVAKKEALSTVQEFLALSLV